MPYRRIVLAAHGGPEQLHWVTEPLLPTPGPGEVRVRVLAAGTGFTDTIIRRGRYPGVKQKPPLTPGYDIVGVVDAVGPGVDRWRVGQRVADMPIIGGYSEYLLRPAASLVAVPDDCDPAEAVCLPLSFVTAWQMLTRVAKLTAGQSVLIHGASGATGTALLVLGRHLGLRLIGTCSASKAGLLREHGCEVIDYRREDIAARVAELTGNGVDAVFDAIGGRHWDLSMRCLRPGGLLVGYGAQNIARGDEPLMPVLLGFAKLMLLWKLLPTGGRRTAFYNIQTLRQQQPGWYADDLGHLLDLLRQGLIQPVVAGRLPLSQAADVHRRIDAGEVSGKLVLEPFGTGHP